jgi:glutamate-1-semialdehyde 2,1-aminomutase
MDWRSMTYSERLNRAIPGGAHTYSRGDDQYPSNAPQILKGGKGAYSWTPEGEKFLDYSMALRAVTLGYANEEVNEAAIEQIRLGNNTTRPSLIELEAAETMVDLIPGMDMVKFAKNGSTVTSGAVKLARAHTGRKYVAVCRQHPFFSYDDWFIGSTVIKKGVPDDISRLTIQFDFNDPASLEKLFEQYEGEISCAILEPATNEEPLDNFLQKVKDICHENGAVFILDEMITGFRWDLKGAQHYYNVEPDLCTFGKGIANGFSVAALMGKREIMDLGSIREEGRERVFLMSSTHGAEMCGMGALLKTIEIYKRDKVTDHLWNFGRNLTKRCNKLSQDLGLGDYFHVDGIACSPTYTIKDKNGNGSMAMRTLFMQEMIKNGVIMGAIVTSFAHGEVEIELTLEAMEKSLDVYKRALEEGVEKYLVGPVRKPVFRKIN